MSRSITIAIDGYSSCGKSTIASGLAEKLNYLYIDSGAMYRAVALYFLREKVNILDVEEISQALKTVEIQLSKDGRAVLNGEEVSDAIRSQQVNDFVSTVAAIPEVRRKLVEMQRAFRNDASGICMDGRDIGTVVFPEAELKLFVTADLKVRTNRRYLELKKRSFDVNRDDVRANLLNRDRIDSTRKDSPLVQAYDAKVLDTTGLTPEKQLDIAFKMAQDVIKG